MSKAFDTVNRHKLFEILEEIMTPDELHIMSILTNLPKIKVKINQTTSTEFITQVGIMQGDCLSAILFILYLSESLKNETKNIDISSSILIKPKYADDITYATTSKTISKYIKRTTPISLKKSELMINHSKTEEYVIPKPPPPPPPPPDFKTLLQHKNDKPLWSALDWLINYESPAVKDKTPDWKTCKLLGSLLDSKIDFERRRILAIEAMKKYRQIFMSKSIGITLKIKTFNIYISSIFLYNSELWGINKTFEDKIDSFHRRLMRNAIGIKWPKKMSTEKLYRITNEERWSRTLRRRRLNFLGHIMRLNAETPVRKSSNEALSITKKNKGRPKTTWLNTIMKDLLKDNIDIRKTSVIETITILTNLTSDRKLWRNRVCKLMQ